MTHGEQTPLRLASSLGSSIHCRQLPYSDHLASCHAFSSARSTHFGWCQAAETVNYSMMASLSSQPIHRSCM